IAAGGLDEGVIPLAWHFIDEEMRAEKDAAKHKPRPKPKSSAYPTTKTRKVHTEAAATSRPSSSPNPSGTFDLFNETDVATSSAPRESAAPTLSGSAATNSASAIGTAQDLDDDAEWRGGPSGSNLGRMGNLVGRLGYLSTVGRSGSRRVH
ncbi:hypothetical protein FRC00_011160, partial [Tulasnella sp. 408]